jgi:hypothetical protein
MAKIKGVTQYSKGDAEDLGAEGDLKHKSRAATQYPAR